MKLLQGVAKAAILPLAILNTLAAIAGGVWILVLHEWRLFGLGLAVILFGDKLLALLMMGQFLLAAPGVWLE